MSDADIIATITALTAWSIAGSYKEFSPATIGEVILAGGGRHNPTLVGMLRALIPDAPISFSDEHGINSDFKEALLFALLAYETWHHRVGTLPEQTGASHCSVLGQITPGKNFVELVRRTFC